MTGHPSKPPLLDDAPWAGVLFVTPSPAQLKAGAVWVTIENWRRACAARWGSARVLTPSGELLDDDIVGAAWGASGTGPLVQSGRLRTLLAPIAGTAGKDLRAWWRMSRFERVVRSLPEPSPPAFVWQHHDLFQRAGFTLARRHNRPLVLFVDAPIVWEATQWGVTRPGTAALVERLGEVPQFRAADLVACVSDEVAEACIALGANSSRVLVTPCTADDVRTATPRQDIRRTHGLEGRTVIGWVGSFREFHNAEAVVRAVGTMPDPGGVGLLMIGDGPTRHRSEQLATDVGLQRAVFSGAVPHQDVPDFLAAFDIAVIPSHATGGFHYSPLKLKEYLAAGKPVVAPSVGEIGRVLRDGEDALLYPVGNDDEMTALIRSLVADPHRRRTLGAQGRQTYDRLFTMDHQLEVVASRLGLP